MVMSADVMAQAQPSKTKATQAQGSSVGNDNTDATQAAFRNALDYLSATLFSHLRQNVSVEDAIDIMLDDAQWQALRQQFELLHSKQAHSPWTESLVKTISLGDASSRQFTGKESGGTLYRAITSNA